MTFSAFISWYSHAANLSWSMSNEIFLDWVLLNYGQKKKKKTFESRFVNSSKEFATYGIIWLEKPWAFAFIGN